MNRSNCLFYALKMFWKHRHSPNNYIRLRLCRKNKFCIHWLHELDGVVTQYTIPDGTIQPGWFGKMLYKGEVKVGDE